MTKASLSPRRIPVQSRSIERVERIISHAAQLIGERGVGRTSMSAIARAADISLASLYRYFPNKEAIIKAIAERHVDRLEAALRGQLPGIGLDQGIDDLIDIYADFYRNEPGYAEIWSGVESMPELQSLDMEELYRNARDVDSAASQLFPRLAPERRWYSSVLLTRTCGQMLRLAMTLPRAEEKGLLQEIKVMVRAYLSQLQRDSQEDGK